MFVLLYMLYMLHIGNFVNNSSIIYDEVCELFETLDDTIILLKRYFGEILLTNNFEVEDDPWSSFFCTFINFASMHKTARQDLVKFEKTRLQQVIRNAARRDKEQQKQQQATSSSHTSSVNDGDSKSSPPVSSITTRPRPLSIGSPRSRSNSNLSCPDTSSPSAGSATRSPNKQGQIDICAVFKERMRALNGEGELSDSDEEW